MEKKVTIQDIADKLNISKGTVSKALNNAPDISEALRFLTNAIKKRCTAFLLSDLIDVDRDGNLGL